MRSKEHKHIVNMFVMPDKPAGPFDPAGENFRDLITYALKKSFNDFNFRTLRQTDQFRNEYRIWKTAQEELRKKKAENSEKVPEPTTSRYLMLRLEEGGFTARFTTYFSRPIPDQDQFDGWHHETCQMFLDILNGDGSHLCCNRAYDNLAYGKAQKIVNMMFKHLYCIEGAGSYAAYFSHCHMVLDNFTLEWFKRTLKEKRIQSWSNLVYKENPVDHNDYLFYQDRIRRYFFPLSEARHTYAGLTPFQAEFYIWPEIQWRMAAENLLKQALPKEIARSSSKIVQDDSIADLCSKLMVHLSTLQSQYE